MLRQSTTTRNHYPILKHQYKYRGNLYININIEGISTYVYLPGGKGGGTGPPNAGSNIIGMGTILINNSNTTIQKYK